MPLTQHKYRVKHNKHCSVCIHSLDWKSRKRATQSSSLIEKLQSSVSIENENANENENENEDGNSNMSIAIQIMKM